MKKYVPYIVTAAVLAAAICTKGFTYLNGKFKPEITSTIWVLIILTGVCYVLSGGVKRYAEKEKLPPI